MLRYFILFTPSDGRIFDIQGRCICRHTECTPFLEHTVQYHTELQPSCAISLQSKFGAVNHSPSFIGLRFSYSIVLSTLQESNGVITRC